MAIDVPRVLEPRWRTLLQHLCARCVSELSVQASVEVSTGDGQWSPGAASSPQAAQLEEYAFTVGEGPCHEALNSHRSVVAADLTTPDMAERWPAWASAAVEAGVLATTALPIEAGAITAGVLTLYADRRWQPTAAQFALARRLTDVALLILLDMAASLDFGSALLDDHLNGDRASSPGIDDGDLSVLLRADVHRAAGMVMVQADIPIDQALTRLRAHAYAAGRPLPDVAQDIIERRLRLAPDVGTAQ